MNFLIDLNGIDIFLGLIYLRALYIGFKNGFVVELFKLAGLIFAVFVSFHYYKDIASAFEPDFVPLGRSINQVFIFLTLWFLVTVVFKLFRDGILMFLSIKPHFLDQWFGAFFAVLRGFLICGMTLFALLLTNHGQIITSAQESFSGRLVATLPIGIYARMYQGVIVKFFPEEEMNQDVLSVVQILDSEKKEL